MWLAVDAQARTLPDQPDPQPPGRTRRAQRARAGRGGDRRPPGPRPWSRWPAGFWPDPPAAGPWPPGHRGEWCWTYPPCSASLTILGADRLRTHPRPAGPRPGLRRDLASVHHRPRHRIPARLRHHHLHPTPTPTRLPAGRAPPLHRPRLRPTLRPHRPRPRHPPPPRRTRRNHQRRQPAPAVPPPPPTQNHRPHPHHHPPRRPHHLDHPHRPAPTTLPPHNHQPHATPHRPPHRPPPTHHPTQPTPTNTSATNTRATNTAPTNTSQTTHPTGPATHRTTTRRQQRALIDDRCTGGNRPGTRTGPALARPDHVARFGSAGRGSAGAATEGEHGRPTGCTPHRAVAARDG